MLNKSKTMRPPVKKRSGLPLSLAGVMLCSTLSTGPSFAASISLNQQTLVASDFSSAKGSYSVNLKQLGSGDTLTLQGQDSRYFINFNASSNEVISQAILKLNYQYSPDLISDKSQINIYLNGERVASLATPKDDANKNLEVTIRIPTELFSENNRFTFQLIGHYDAKCEDPKSPKLWAKIGGQSTLIVNGLPLLLSNNLANLPIPFTSKYSSRRLILPFAFKTAPNNTELEAAGIVSSWLGSKSAQSGVQFPVLVNSLPSSGNAIIFVDSETSFPGIALPIITGPMLFIASNPKDPYGKFLFVMGKNKAELKQAATSLALGTQVLSGQVTSLIPVTQIPERKPYDAPNWLSEAGPVKLNDLTVDTNPKLDFDIQLPPDLYSEDKTGIPINLNYSYDNQLIGNGGVLNVTYKTQAIKTIPLQPQNQWIFNISKGINNILKQIGISKSKGEIVDKEVTTYIPQALIYPNYESSVTLNKDQISLGPFLQTNFSQIPEKSGNCYKPELNGPIDATLNPSSSIDISGMQHFISMPNLAAFSNSGFPFSRLADLSETAAILPDTPNLKDYAALFNILGRMGRLTGYPSISLTVANYSQLRDVKNKDLLIITSGSENQAILHQWESLIPSSNQVNISFENGIRHLQNFLNSSPKFDIYKNTFLTGFQSPLDGNRSVILVSSFNPDYLNDISTSLDGSMGFISGSLVRLNEGQIELMFDKQTYESGTLPFVSKLSWLFSKNELLFILFISIISTCLMSLLFYIYLKNKRIRRLRE